MGCPIEFVERVRGESKMNTEVATESLRRITRWGMAHRRQQLARRRVDAVVDDLDRHQLIHYASTMGNKSPGWEYFDGTRRRFKPMRGAITVDNAQSYQAACIAGLGLIQVPAMLNPEGLVEVLPDHACAPMPVAP